jgi:hypothetical protein
MASEPYAVINEPVISTVSVSHIAHASLNCTEVVGLNYILDPISDFLAVV